MTKITKRIWLAICSCAFAVSLAFTGWIFADTNKAIEADAASEPTVAFMGINEAQNNADWEKSPGFGFTAVNLMFEGADFVGTSANGVAGITYTVPGGTAQTFGFTWVQDASYSANANLNTIILLNQNISIPDGSTLNIVKGTEYAGQILPEVTLYMVEGKWQAPVKFVGINEAQNNADWEKSPGFGFTAVNLMFEGADFVGTSANGVAGITYTVPGGTAQTFGFTWVQDASYSANANLNTIILLNQNISIPDGSTLNIAAGTVYAGRVLPEVSLVMQGSKWVDPNAKEKPTVALDSIDATQNNTKWNNSDNGWMAVYMTFTGADLTGDNYGLSATLPYGVSCVPVGATPDNYGIWRNGNQLQFLYFTDKVELSDGSTFTIAEGTSLYGQIFPEVNLVVKGGKWIDANAPEKEPTVTFEVVEKTQNNVTWADNANWKGTYLTFSGNAFNESKDANPDGIYFTNADGTGKTKFSAVWTSADYGATLNMVQLLSDGQAIPTGAILHIEKGTEIGGQILPEVTLYMNYEGKWQDTVPSPEPTVELVKIVEGQNNDSWNNLDNGWYALYLKYNAQLSNTNIREGITGVYYTVTGSSEQHALTVWVTDAATTSNSDLSTLMILTQDNIPEGAVLHIEKNTAVGSQRLPALTLYLVAGDWVTEKPVAVEFTGIGAHNNDNWLATGEENPNPAFVALDLTFNVDFETATTANTGIYYTVPGNDTPNYFNYVWANNETADANVIQLLMSKDAGVNPKGFYPDSAILHITEGTVVGGKVLPALTLYLNTDGEWQEEKCLQKYSGFTTEEGGWIRVSSDGQHNGLRFESQIDYAQYNALVASGENKNAVELGTYILPKH